MILTKEFLETQNACANGVQAVIENNFIGQEYSNVIRGFIAINQKDFAGWLIEQKSTEAYVRGNGNIMTTGKVYQVFNPLTGTHTEYQTETEAKLEISKIYKEIIATHKPTVCQSISNENGDSTWISVDIVKSIEVTVN